MKLLASLAITLALFACSKEKDDPVAPADPVAKPTETATPTEPAGADKPAEAKPEGADWVKHVTPTVDHPVVGKPAPDFKLKDLDGKEVALASFKGKTVVLEWFNPGCPFVKKAHGVGSLVDTAQRHSGGAVWLAINSGGAGKQGADPKMNVESAKSWKMAHPVLLDTTGTVGKAYGATNTPHMFVIDKSGNVVYGGAIDNSPDGEKKSPEGGNLINYVDAALEDVAAGRPVRTPVTKAYGCSVKYAAS